MREFAKDFPFEMVVFFVFVFGTVFGSFLNVCIHRFPKFDRLKDQLTGIWGRSGCPRCKTEILARDNIPIIGWLLLRGKCRSCNLKISSRYPLIELGNGLLFVLVFLFQFPEGFLTFWDEQCCANPMGPQIVSHVGAYSADTWMYLRFLFHMVLIESLVVATFIDLDLQIIPDGCTVPSMIFAIIASTVVGQLFLVPIWWNPLPVNQAIMEDLLPQSLSWVVFDFDGIRFAKDHPHIHGLLNSLCGLLVGGGSIWAVRIIGHQALKREAMGFGDVVLMAAIGSFIGWQPVTIVFFLAAMCAMVAVMFGVVFGWRQEIPYGPYLSLGALLLILFWDKIWPRAEPFFDYGVGIFFFAGTMGIALFVSLLMLQGVKRILGIPLYEERHEGEWTSADTLHHFAGEKIDDQTCQWKRPTWEGSLSGRGLRQHDIWRNP
ncbi:MAG: A24 family peptidase [Planctomycetaceae bacterium]